MYADDITIAVSNKKSAKIALKIIRNFKIISGLELNTEKTHGMWLGFLKNSKKQHFGIDWKKDPIKALGVHFSHNKAKSTTANFDEKIEKLKSKLNIWSLRDMTIFGLACIVNTIGLSQFLNLATVIYFPEKKIKTINQLVSKFIWRGRKPKVKKKTLIKDISEGGIGLIDLNSKVKALQASRVVKYNLDPGGDSLWKHIWRHYLGPKGDDLLFYCNYDSDIVRSIVGLPDYYKKVFTVWSEISNRSVLGNVQEIKYQLIWNNRYVKVDKKCVFYKTLFETGAIRVRNLFLGSNTLKLFQYWVDKGVKASLFLEWMAVIDAIPKEWRGLIRNSNFNDAHRIHSTELKLIIGDEKIALQTLKTKSIHNFFVKKLALPPTNKERLTSQFQIQDEQEGKNIYCLPSLTNANRRAQELQYRLF